jgi:hypothetical protein
VARQRERDPVYVNTVTNDMKRGVGSTGETAARAFRPGSPDPGY